MPPGYVDPFARLGIDPRFGLDLAALDAKQRELSRKLHPDRHAAASPAERRRVLGEAMDVNQAYRQLKDPVSRAEALLERLGIDKQQAREHKESPAFLMEVLERREALSEARSTRNLELVRELERGMRAERERIEQRLATIFDGASTRASLDSKAGAAALEPGVVGQVLELVGRLRYVRRFLDEVASIEDELG